MLEKSACTIAKESGSLSHRLTGPSPSRVASGIISRSIKVARGGDRFKRAVYSARAHLASSFSYLSYRAKSRLIELRGVSRSETTAPLEEKTIRARFLEYSPLHS